MDAETAWALETFGHAALGDPRRTMRLVRVAAAAAREPNGTVTIVIQDPAEREGAFRLLENPRVEPQLLSTAVRLATARSCREHDLVTVALDQTSLAVVDRKDVRGLGPTGRHSGYLRGLEVLCGLALDPKGAVIGLSAMSWFIRPHGGTKWGKKDTRAPEQRESWMWIDAMRSTIEALKSEAPDTRAWFQCDRGADHWRLFAEALEKGHYITVRAAHDRALRGPANTRRKLSTAMNRAPVLGYRSLVVKSDGRTARLSLRAKPVTLLAKTDKRRWQPIKLWCVDVREVGGPRLAKIAWRLLTTFPVTDLESANRVIEGYTLRWRSEEFHRTWKQGGCNVERSQLRSADALKRWAIVLAAVASRIERLKRLHRTQPDEPALTELTQDEIDAAIVLSKTKKLKLGDQPTLGVIVELIAQVGGYTGKSSGGPPGSITIGRGLNRVTAAAQMARAMRETSG